MADNTAIRYPSITSSQYILFYAELRTGIIMALDRKNYSTNDRRYLIFSSLEAAEEFACSEIAFHPHLECIILDHEHKTVSVFRPEYQPSIKGKHWWQFWR